MKRFLDVLLSALLLAILSPLLAATALAVRLGLGPGVLFRQERPGLGGRPFTLLKFRTMRPGPGPDAARLTRLGRFLRRASLDELPELWNVLRGDMSLVGPRPLLMRYLPLYTPRQARRMEVLPGITGWAQVNGRNALTWEERFELDIWYVEHRSLVLDLRILGRTAWTVLSGRGVSAPGQATMQEFRGPVRQEENG
ncbi:sugar transferase [Desulfovibrio sp.]